MMNAEKAMYYERGSSRTWRIKRNEGEVVVK